MSCEQYQDAIGELVDAARIDEARRIEVEAHLRDCPECRALYADLRAIRTAAAHLPVVPAPERVWARLSAQLPAPATAPA